VDGVSGGNFLKHITLVDRLHGELSLELGVVNVGIAKLLLRRLSQRVEILSRAVPRLNGSRLGLARKIMAPQTVVYRNY
jgi:hypothetical protein